MRCGIVVNVTGPPPTIDRRYHDAVIVGLDNVVDKATRVHAAAWTKFLDDYLTRRPQRTGEDHCPLTHDDYRRFLAGKPDGVADFLAARGIRLPPGSPTDLTDDTVYGLQNLERQTFLQLLNTGVPEGKSIASFARRLQVAGVRVAAHTSHRNYGHTLDATGLAEVFAVFVDGAVTAELGLPAEPNPAGLIETAKRLGANPGRCVVIDSCQTGLRAGRNGGFALVIAVDAHGDAENLLSSGADAVVADLAAVTVGSGDAAISTIPDALQVYSQLKRLLTGRRPAVFLDFDGTLSDIVERPEAATLVDGAAEALRALAAQCPVAVISGRDLADVRNRVKVDGLWLAGSHGFELVAPDGSHHQNAAATAAIDGLAEAAAQLADALREIAGAVVEHKRFAVAVHYRNVADDSVDNLIAAVRRLGHAAGLRVTTGRKVVELRPDIAWDKGKALDWIGERLGPAEVGPDLRLPIYIGDDLTDEDAFDAVRFTGVGIVVRHNEHGDRRSAATFRLECPYTVCQFLSQLACDLQEAVQHDDPWTLVFHGYDPGQERLREALCAVGNGYLGSRGCAPESAESEAHYPGTYVAGVYNQLTDHIEGCIPARGLNGEAYRGHVFWDALFVAPVLSLRMPKVARSLLDYRYRRLPAARRAAHRAGHLGAMYPWQSGSDGSEVSQQLHLNPRSGRWTPDPSDRAHHVGLAVAYNAWHYYQVTGDRQYLVDCGAELLVEIARFWVGLAKLDDSRGRYLIRGVIGPDEFHSGYPGNEYDGIDNNAYTNVMAVWVILRAMEALDLLPLTDRRHLIEKLGLTTQERDQWDDVSRRMFVPFHDGVISQFEGYSELAELDWDHYRHRYGNIQRLDRILEAEGDSVNNYQASKQADALMLLYLLSSDELIGLLARLGYRFAPTQIPGTVDYYLARTSDGSTLSAVVHAWVLARANRSNAMEYFRQVLRSDIADVQGGTTQEGIHLAAMAGSIDLLQRCYSGLELRDDRLVLSPQWPEALGPLEFPFVYRRHQLSLRISGRSATLTAESGDAEPIEVECRGHVQRLRCGHTIEVGCSR